MMRGLLRLISPLRRRFKQARTRRRWARLRELGMHIGQGVNLPASTGIDPNHCFLISIGDWCGFGPDCMILAHEGQMDEFLDAGRIGRVTIHAHTHIGARTVILPGVEIGPRTIVGANSVVTKSLPPDTVCAGNPARVICSLDEYLERFRTRMADRPKFEYMKYGSRHLTPERRAELVAAVADGDAYIVGGFFLGLAPWGGGDANDRDRLSSPDPGVTCRRRGHRRGRPTCSVIGPLALAHGVEQDVSPSSNALLDIWWVTVHLRSAFGSTARIPGRLLTTRTPPHFQRSLNDRGVYRVRRAVSRPSPISKPLSATRSGSGGALCSTEEIF